MKTIPSLEAFLQGNQPVVFFILGDKAEHYQFIHETLPQKDKGLVIQYLLKMTDYSRQQLTRLFRQYTITGKINCDLAAVITLLKHNQDRFPPVKEETRSPMKTRLYSY